MPWTRVKDNDTKHEYSVQVVDPDAHAVIDKDAVDALGRPLPVKHYTTKGGTPAAKEALK